MDKMCFVFGSNEAGIHGAGAARDAYSKYGAVWGRGYGLYGTSFAIPTKDVRIKTLPVSRVESYIEGFLAFAEADLPYTYQITRIGCGLAGFTDAQIAPLFWKAGNNCFFDTKWKPWLGAKAQYWGTV